MPLSFCALSLSARHMHSHRMHKLIGCPHTGEIASSVYFSICSFISFAIFCEHVNEVSSKQ